MKSDQNMSAKNITVNRVKLIFIFSLFLGPLLGAFIWYYGLNASFIPEGKANHAPLIEPLISLEPFSNAHHGDGEINFDSLKRKWTIVHLLPSVCSDQCEKSIYNSRQTRLAVGKDANRIQRFLILENPDLGDEMVLNHADAKLLFSGESGLEDQLEKIMKDSAQNENDALLIDPLGNVMMLIPLDLEPRLLLKDLKKLLKLSRIG